MRRDIVGGNVRATGIKIACRQQRIGAEQARGGKRQIAGSRCRRAKGNAAARRIGGGDVDTRDDGVGRDSRAGDADIART